MIDPHDAHAVQDWRKLERERLISARLALAPDYRAAQAQAIARELDARIPAHAGPIVSAYWPIRGEPDLRPWMHAAAARGLRIALPVAVALRQPLQFRAWRPGAAMARGLWNIPHPAEMAVVVPDMILAPLVGYDRAGYRLGYGGGFFDRTLAQFAPRPVTIGIGYPEAAIESIYPQPFDIPMSGIVTGSRAGASGPPGA
ncbi:MAG: 5-formyltetrahydrofolate cyclo-ligase [Gammaproteobacteria bacterium]|nr:5-formyltetrahydrofolate cyclo-ligase [Gammaproteobacteria bacterium]